MGYYADSIEIDFTIPADKVAAALEAMNANEAFTESPYVSILDPHARDEKRKVYTSLAEAVNDWTTFESTVDDEKGFSLGWTHDKYLSYTDDVLATLAPFADEGSYVRLIGEDHTLYGFIVKDGKLEEQYGQITWI